MFNSYNFKDNLMIYLKINFLKNGMNIKYFMCKLRKNEFDNFKFEL